MDGEEVDILEKRRVGCFNYFEFLVVGYLILSNESSDCFNLVFDCVFSVDGRDRGPTFEDYLLNHLLIDRAKKTS